MRDTRIGGGLKELLCIFTRCEVMGAAEGRVEGEVKEGNRRMLNRYRIRSWLFGKEHTVNQLLRVFKDEHQDIIWEAAKLSYQRHGEPLYSINSKSENLPSVALCPLLQPAVQSNINQSESDLIADEFNDNDY